MLSYLFVNLLEWQNDKEGERISMLWFTPQTLAKASIGQLDARSLELKPELLRGWQEPTASTFHRSLLLTLAYVKPAARSLVFYLYCLSSSSSP